MMAEEMDEQAEVVERMLVANRAKQRLLAEAATGVSHVVVAARGTSDNAARYAQYVWGARNRLSVGLTTPSLFGILAAPPSLTGALVVGISQSGQSPDLVEVLTHARRQERPTVAITNDLNSPLAAAAEVVIDLCAGPERAVAATKTYTAELAAVAACSVAFAGGDQELMALVPPLRAAVVDSARHASAVAGLVESDRCVIVGRGFHHATVHEWALKLQELTYILAQPFSAADFLHGPVAVVEEGFPVLAVVTAGPTESQMRDVVEAMQARGAHVVTLSDVDDAIGDVAVRLPRVEPWLSPIVAAPYIQHLSRALALARGLDPDAPRGLTKVTRTR
jgi:glucosamine--fructose-6-phosphate aminotransferase (isomerizing)